MTTKQKPLPIQPWERQEGESPEAYRSFRAWLETVPAADRSFTGTYRHIYSKPAAQCPAGYFSAWVVKYHWRARALEYDNHLFRIEHEARLKALQAAQARWAKRKEQIAEDDFQDGEKLRLKVREIIALPVVRQTLTNTSVSEDGHTTINQYVIEPLRVRAADAANMLKLASERQRLAAEMATSIIETVDPQHQTGKRLDEARRVLVESRERFPDVDEGERIAQIVAAFRVRAEDLIAPSLG